MENLPLALLPCGSSNSFGVILTRFVLLFLILKAHALGKTNLLEMMEKVMRGQCRGCDTMQITSDKMVDVVASRFVDIQVHWNPITLGIGTLAEIDYYHEGSLLWLVMRFTHSFLDKLRWLGYTLKTLLSPICTNSNQRCFLIR